MYKRVKVLLAQVLTVILCLNSTVGSAAGVLKLPSALKVVEDEAFYGAQMIDEVVMPEGAERIGSKAFADSTLKAINLPDSIQNIADDAFDGCDPLTVTVESGSYAHTYAQGKGIDFVLAGEESGELRITSVLADKTQAAVGDIVTWTAEAAGGTEPYRYYYELYYEGMKIDTRAYSTDAAYAFEMTDAGTYYVIAKVRDADYTVVQMQSESLSVSAEGALVQITGVIPDQQQVTTGDTVTWTVTAEGGMQPYRYAYTLLRGEETIASQNYGEENTFSYTLDTEGEYQLLVRVADANNNQTELQGGAVIANLPQLTLTAPVADLEQAVTDDTVTWTVYAEGGLAPYTYAFTLTLGGETIASADALSEGLFSYTFTQPGSYVLSASVTDAKGNTATTQSGYTVALRALNVLSLTADLSAPLTGDTITWTAEAEGGVEPYQYAFSIFAGEEEMDFRAYAQENTFAYTPEDPGEYSVQVLVRDSAGTTASMTSDVLSVVLRPLSITSVMADTDMLKLGDAITWTTEAVGGVSPLRYAFDVYKDGEVITTRAYGLLPTYAYTPQASGSYHVTAYVRDTEMTVVQTDSAAVTVYDPLALSAITPDLTSVLTGEAVTWTVEGIGGKNTITYDYEVYWGETLEFVSRKTVPTLTYAPMREGTYTVKVTVTDEGGDISEISGGAVEVALHGSSPAEDFTYTVLNGTYCSVTGYTGTDTAVVIPEMLDEYIVQTVAGSMFKNNISIVSVVLPDSVESIGNYAFQGCTSLMSFVGGENLTTISAYAFAGCTGMTSVKLPENLTTIYERVFENCTSLERIYLPDSVTTISNQVFRGCSKLVEVNYPLNWTTMKNVNNTYSPFNECTKLTSIVVPEGATTIPAYAFYGCSNLTSITIPETVTSVGSNAFYNCTNLSIYGVSGSYAETYATANSIPFNPAPAPEVTLTVEATGDTVGSSIHAVASAAHAAAPYAYRFSLYQDGVMIRQTDYSEESERDFTVYEMGTYQVVADAKDRIGLIGTAYGGTMSFGEAEVAVLSGRVLDDSGNPVENAVVTIEMEAPAAQTLSTEAEGTVTLLSDADGLWSWDQAVIGATYAVSFAKEGLTFDTVLSTLVDSIWGIVTAPVYALGKGYTENEAEYLIEGMITTEDGSAVRGVSVVLSDALGNYIGSTMTDDNGRWGFGVEGKEAVYTVTYDQNLLKVMPESETVTVSGNVSLTAMAQLLQGDASDEVSFVMDASSIIVGNAATFTITVPEDVVKARLIVDGIPYDVIYPQNGTCEYTRVFTSAGERSIAFQIARDGEWAAMSAAQTLSVKSNGKLDAPVYADIASHYTGEALTVDWQDIANAQAYVVRLYRGGTVVGKFEPGTESFVQIPGTYFASVGQYSVSVMATGVGYSQSGTDDLFDVVLRDYRFDMTSPVKGNEFVIGDTIWVNITQSGGGYMAVEVTEPSGRVTWYPEDENGVVPITAETITIPVPVTQSGVYSVTPYLYSVDEITTGIAPVLTGKTVEVTVNGPAIRGIYPSGGSYTWVYANEAQSVRVTTNNAADGVEIYEDKVCLGTASMDSENNFVRTFNVSLAGGMEKGEHAITATAVDSANSASANKLYTYYVVEPVANGANVYPQAETVTLYSSPYNGKTVAQAQGGRIIDALKIIGDADTWYQVRMSDGTEGFVPCDLVDTKAWEGATGEIMTTCPPDQVKLIYLPQHQLLFDWDTGLVVPEGAEYTVTVDGLTTQTHITETVTDSEALISMDELPTDEYTWYVELRKDGEVLAQSVPVSFAMGDFSLADSYRDWWKQNIAAPYSNYLKNGDPFYGKASAWHGIHGFIDLEITAGVRPQIIFDPATLAYTQILHDFVDLDKDSRTNAENNWSLTSIDQESLRRTTLLSISRAMLEEKEKGNLVLKKDLSNVDSIASSNQTIAKRDAAADAVFAVFGVVMEGVKVALNAYSVTHEGADVDDAIEEFMEPFEDLIEDLEKVVDESLEKQDILLLLSSYADVYVEMLKNASDVYVECLENTYRGNGWQTPGSYSYYVQEYIDAFHVKQNENSELYDYAYEQIVKDTGYTTEQIKNLELTCIAEFCKVLTKHYISELITDYINEPTRELFGEDAPEILSYDVESGFSINWEETIEGVEGGVVSFVDWLEHIGEAMVEENFRRRMRADIKESLDTGVDLPANYIEEQKNVRDKELEIVDEWDDILEDALELVHSSWNLGVKLEELGVARSTLKDQKNNKGLFDTYGLRLISAFKLRTDLATKLPDYDWDNMNMSILSVNDLEKYRQALVTLTNYDSDIMINYRNMRTINDGNGNKFDYDLDWMEKSEIDERRKLIQSYRKDFLNSSAVYDTLFQ